MIVSLCYLIIKILKTIKLNFAAHTNFNKKELSFTLFIYHIVIKLIVTQEQHKVEENFGNEITKYLFFLAQSSRQGGIVVRTIKQETQRSFIQMNYCYIKERKNYYTRI